MISRAWLSISSCIEPEVSSTSHFCLARLDDTFKISREQSAIQKGVQCLQKPQVSAIEIETSAHERHERIEQPPLRAPMVADIEAVSIETSPSIEHRQSVSAGREHLTVLDTSRYRYEEKRPNKRIDAQVASSDPLQPYYSAVVYSLSEMIF